MSASTAAETNRRQRQRVADAITVSSNPMRAAGTTLPGSAAACCNTSRTADHTVCHFTLNSRTNPATDAPDAPNA